MRCEEVRNGLADYLTGGLPESTRAEWRQHLASCAACRAEATALEEIWSALGEIPAEPVDRVAMRARFDGLLAAQPQKPGRVRSAMQRWPQRLVVQAAFGAALFVAGLLVGGFVLMPGSPTPSASPAALDLVELRLELHDMREMLALSLIQQQSASERLRGVSWSNQIDQPGSDIVTALLETLLHDPNVNVRLAAVGALRRFSAQDDVRRGTLEALSDSSSPLVQIALIDYIVETRDKQAADGLRRLSKDAKSDEAVRGRAAWGLERLSS